MTDLTSDLQRLNLAKEAATLITERSSLDANDTRAVMRSLQIGKRLREIGMELGVKTPFPSAEGLPLATAEPEPEPELEGQKDELAEVRKMFAKWVHPTNGEIRVYLNNLPRSAGAKIWLVADGKDWDMKVNAERGQLNVTRDELLNSIDFWLKKLNGGRIVNTFDRILELIDPPAAASGA